MSFGWPAKQLQILNTFTYYLYGCTKLWFYKKKFWVILVCGTKFLDKLFQSKVTANALVKKAKYLLTVDFHKKYCPWSIANSFIVKSKMDLTIILLTAIIGVCLIFLLKRNQRRIKYLESLGFPVVQPGSISLSIMTSNIKWPSHSLVEFSLNFGKNVATFKKCL